MTLYLIIAVAAWFVFYLDGSEIKANRHLRYYPPAPELGAEGG